MDEMKALEIVCERCAKSVQANIVAYLNKEQENIFASLEQAALPETKQARASQGLLKSKAALRRTIECVYGDIADRSMEQIHARLSLNVKAMIADTLERHLHEHAQVMIEQIFTERTQLLTQATERINVYAPVSMAYYAKSIAQACSLDVACLMMNVAEEYAAAKALHETPEYEYVIVDGIRIVKPSAGGGGGGGGAGGAGAGGSIAKPPPNTAGLSAHELGKVLTEHQKAWISGLAGKQKNALENYTGPYSGYMNKYLRHGDDVPSWAKTDSAILKGALEKSAVPADLTVYRGVKGNTLTPEFFQQNVGKTFQDKGFVSTTIASGGTANDFASTFSGHAVVMHIAVPKGAKGAYVDSISSTPGEKELLLQAGTQFHIVSVEKVAGVTQVHLKVVPSKNAQQIEEHKQKTDTKKPKKKTSKERFFWDDGDFTFID